MTLVIFQPSTEYNLEKIGDFIALDDPIRALSFVQELRRACQKLDIFPKRFPLCPELGSEIRKMAYKGYTAFYRYDENRDTVYILGILEDHQDY